MSPVLRREPRLAALIAVGVILTLPAMLVALIGVFAPSVSTASRVNHVCSGRGGALQLASDTVICRDGLAFTLH